MNRVETADASRLEVLHALLLLQGAMLLLSGVMMLVFSGGAAWPLTIGGPLFLFVLAAGTVRRWRWVRLATMAVQGLMLLSFAASALLGLLPQLAFSVNLMTLISNVCLPLAVIALARRTRSVAAPVAVVDPGVVQAAA